MFLKSFADRCKLSSSLVILNWECGCSLCDQAETWLCQRRWCWCSHVSSSLPMAHISPRHQNKLNSFCKATYGSISSQLMFLLRPLCRCTAAQQDHKLVCVLRLPKSTVFEQHLPSCHGCCWVWWSQNVVMSGFAVSLCLPLLLSGLILFYSSTVADCLVCACPSIHSLPPIWQV